MARALINLFFPCIDKQSSTHSLRDVRRCNFIFGPEGVFEETYRHPRHHTAQVRADGVDPILLDARAGGVGYQVGGVSLVRVRDGSVKGEIQILHVLTRYKKWHTRPH